MARERTVVQGIVLRGVDTKESDRILTVLTAQMGKVAVVAKGARSRRSRVTAAAQLLAYSDMVLTESHGWQILSEASTITLFDGVRQDVVLLSLGSYFADLTESVTFEGYPGRRSPVPPLRRRGRTVPDAGGSGRYAPCCLRGRQAAVQLHPLPGGSEADEPGRRGLRPGHAGAGLPYPGLLQEPAGDDFHRGICQK